MGRHPHHSAEPVDVGQVGGIVDSGACLDDVVSKEVADLRRLLATLATSRRGQLAADLVGREKLQPGLAGYIR